MARNKYPEQTRDLIVDTATKLFYEKGYDHTTIQDIINHLGGLSKGAIYHHFKSKEEIMWAVADKMYTGLEDNLREICERTDVNGREKLRMVFNMSLQTTSSNKIWETMPDMFKNPQLLVMYFQETVQKDAPQMVRKILEEGICDGSIQTEYPRELSEVIMLMGDFWLNPMIYHCEPQDTVRKMKFFQQTLKQWGVDVIDDACITSLEKVSTMINEHQLSET